MFAFINSLELPNFFSKWLKEFSLWMILYFSDVIKNFLRMFGIKTDKEFPNFLKKNNFEELYQRICHAKILKIVSLYVNFYGLKHICMFINPSKDKK